MIPEMCPKCHEESPMLIDQADDLWEMWKLDYDPDDDLDVWLCVGCGWNEEAETEDAIEYHSAQLEWVMAKVASNQESRED